jgi:hypothetical protein
MDLGGTLNNWGFFSQDGSLFVRLLPQTWTGTLLIGTVIPELSTWAMMLVGFAGLGFTAFRTKKAVSAASAI